MDFNLQYSVSSHAASNARSNTVPTRRRHTSEHSQTNQVDKLVKDARTRTGPGGRLVSSFFGKTPADARHTQPNITGYRYRYRARKMKLDIGCKTVDGLFTICLFITKLRSPDKRHGTVGFTVCFTVCLFFSPDLDGCRAYR